MDRKGKGKAKQPVEKPLSSLLASKQQLLQSSRYSQTCRGSAECPYESLEQCLRSSCPSDLFQSLDLSSVKPDQCLTCICLGLGSLRDSPKSLLQLAFLLDVLPTFPSIQFVVFADPAFTQEDLDYLRSLGYEAQLEDYDLNINEPSFLYMPHCPRFLYESLLASNVNTLEHLILLSNDLKMYSERELRKEELDKIPQLRGCGQYIESVPLPTFEDRPDAFNDMAWHYVRAAAKSETESDVDILSVGIQKLDV